MKYNFIENNHAQHWLVLSLRKYCVPNWNMVAVDFVSITNLVYGGMSYKPLADPMLTSIHKTSLGNKKLKTPWNMKYVVLIVYDILYRKNVL